MKMNEQREILRLQCQLTRLKLKVKQERATHASQTNAPDALLNAVNHVLGDTTSRQLLFAPKKWSHRLGVGLGLLLW